MGREKQQRKTRLNKGESGDFIGFGAFANANPASVATTTSAASTATPTTTSAAAGTTTPNNGSSSNSGLSFSPVYIGNHSDLSIIFGRIGTKRDPTTKTKALQELKLFLSEETQYPKKVQIDALCHFLYLFQTKLYYESTASVRTSSFECCTVAMKRFPKAWKTLTTSTQQGCEMLGMILCSRSDPSADVRLAAQDAVKAMMMMKESDNDDSDYDEKGFWKYAQRILSYGNSKKLYEDLFAKNKKKITSSTKKDEKSSSTTPLSEKQKEEMEEKYDRLISTTLGGIRLYLLDQQRQVQVDQGTNNNNLPDDMKFIWKTTIACPKPTLRLQTYQLLTVACQKIPKSLDQDKLSKLFNQSLSSEKVPANIPALLEAMLSFVANMSSSSEDRTQMIAMYTKTLTKLFKKGCYGATNWSPMVLPIVALLPPEEQPNVLTSVWEGRTNLVGMVDTLKVVEAVAETATFLLQRPSLSSEQQDFAEVIASCWFECFKVYLQQNNLTGIARQTHQNLGLALANDLYQLNNTCSSSSSSSSLTKESSTSPTSTSTLIGYLNEWFWNEKLVDCILDATTENSGHLSLLLEQLLKFEQAQQAKAKAISTNDNAAVAAASTNKSSSLPFYAKALVDKFHQTLTRCQGSSGLVPTVDTYKLWIIILKVIPISQLFIFNAKGEDAEQEDASNNNSLERFIANDLLRWMVIHTSTLSEQANEQLIKFDIEVFWYCCCQDNDPPAAGSFQLRWNSTLRELIAAKCDLQYLATGCLVRLVELGCSTNMIKSNQLDDLSVQVAMEAVEHHHHDHEGDASIVSSHAGSSQVEVEQEYHLKTCDFLQTCSGLGEIDDCLVEQSTIDKWTVLACPNDSQQIMEANPVLETLVALARNDGLDANNLHKVVIQCWRQGDEGLWEKQVLPWLNATKSDDLCSRFVALASKELSSMIRQTSSESKFDQALPIEWADRAFRLLELCRDKSSGKEETVPRASLTLVGLADLTLWMRKEEEGGGSFVAKCLLRLMTLVKEKDHRWMLVANSDVDADELIVQILMSLSSASSTSIIKASLARCRKDACAVFIAQLGRDNLSKSHTTCISTLSSCMRHKAPESRICCGIAVLSQLLELEFSKLKPAAAEPSQADEMLEADQIKKGDALWYIPDPEVPNKREACCVVKIHSDLPEELYFTIQTIRDETPQERQTVLARLRQRDYATLPVLSSEANVKDGMISINAIPSDEYLRRERTSKMIMDELVTPHWESWSDVQYEILNIILTQTGVLDRGIGSAHFTIIQKLISMHGAVSALLAAAEEMKEDLISSLQRLSISLGYGWNTPPSRGSISILGLPVTDSLEALTEYYNDSGPGDDSSIDEAVASWLAVAGRNIESAELCDKVHSLMFQLTAQVFKSCSDDTDFGTRDLIALRVMHAAQVQSHETTSPGQSVVQDDEANAIKEMVTAFACRWETTIIGDGNSVDQSFLLGKEVAQQPLWASLPVVNSVIDASLTHRSALTGAAVRCNIDSIISCLLNPSKQSVALRLIQVYVAEGIPIHEEPENAINEMTAKRLQGWSESLVNEEAEELEEDIELVAQWIPRQLMNEIESWQEENEVTGEDEAFGRMVLWLAFLDIADIATRKGSLIRPALTSYVRYSKSAESALDLAVAYGNTGSDGRLKLEGAGVADIRVLFQAKKPAEDLVTIAASSVVFRTVEVLPTLSKTWWEVTCPSYCSQAVKDFVESTVSPQILRKELDRMKRYTAFGEMTVRGSAVSREVTALYKQDDFTLTVVVKLPPSFPFGRAEVDCSKTLGVPEQRSKRWSLQISLMLNNQGGTLIDALILWKENVDKEFEGVEPCPVCYSVLHVKTHKLPEMECKTCSNRFHFDCLTQWFRSSGKSACVICQQPWSGTRVT